MQNQSKNFNEYIQHFPADTQQILKKIRLIIKKAAPEATESISYQIPAFKLNGVLIYFAAFKDHISLYPRTKSIEAHFKKEIIPFSKGKGTLYFSLEKPIPYDLIEKIAIFRTQEQESKRRKK